LEDRPSTTGNILWCALSGGLGTINTGWGKDYWEIEAVRKENK